MVIMNFMVTPEEFLDEYGAVCVNRTTDSASKSIP